MAASGALIENPVIDQKHQDRADERHEQAVETEVGYALSGELLEQESAHYRPGDTKNQVGDDTPSLLVHDPGRSKAADQTQDHPSNNRHWTLLSSTALGDDPGLDQGLSQSPVLSVTPIRAN